MTEAEEKELIEKTIKSVAGLVLDPVLRLWESDPHQFSERPCQTCRSISALVRRPFGCERSNH
jgi:hypothetical protein